MSEDVKRLDGIDRKIVQILQDDFPIVEHPWKEVGDRLNITEADVIKRVKRLNELGITKKIGSIVDAPKVGLTAATLVAMKVPKNRVDDVAQTINRFGNISHNYEREHEFNIWFTITASSNEGLTSILEEIKQKTGIHSSNVLNLPTKQRFKVNVRFQLT